MARCNLTAACASLREEWTKAIQAVADRLQKQEEEMMDSSPDPMDMEVYLTKPRQKVVRPNLPCSFIFPDIVTFQCLILSLITPPCSHTPPHPIFLLLSLATFHTLPASAVGDLAADEMSPRFHKPHMSWHRLGSRPPGLDVPHATIFNILLRARVRG